jgi:hypothetical protein
LLLPASIRDKSKRLLDTMIGRGEQAVAATAIVVLAAQELTRGPRVLGAVVLVLALVWLGVALMLRAPYLDVFRTALARGELPEGEQELDLSAVETILESLASPEEAQVVAAIDLLAHTRKNRLLPALILYHESPVVLEHALAVFATDTRVSPRGPAPRRDGPPAERLCHRDPTVWVAVRARCGRQSRRGGARARGRTPACARMRPSSWSSRAAIRKQTRVWRPCWQRREPTATPCARRCSTWSAPTASRAGPVSSRRF